ncbi:MAG: hypothetical protein ABFR53_13365, partial [Actinomycetota bacterium]
MRSLIFIASHLYYSVPTGIPQPDPPLLAIVDEHTRPVEVIVIPEVEMRLATRVDPENRPIVRAGRKRLAQNKRDIFVGRIGKDLCNNVPRVVSEEQGSLTVAV